MQEGIDEKNEQTENKAYNSNPFEEEEKNKSDQQENLT
jgi:hypothetical protein